MSDCGPPPTRPIPLPTHNIHKSDEHVRNNQINLQRDALYDLAKEKYKKCLEEMKKWSEGMRSDRFGGRRRTRNKRRNKKHSRSKKHRLSRRH